MNRKTGGDFDLSLAEALGSVAAGGVGQEGSLFRLDGNVVVKGDVLDLDIIVGPPAEELDLGEVVAARGSRGGIVVSHAGKRGDGDKEGEKAKEKEKEKEKEKITKFFFFFF